MPLNVLVKMRNHVLVLMLLLWSLEIATVSLGYIVDTVTYQNGLRKHASFIN